MRNQPETRSEDFVRICATSLGFMEILEISELAGSVTYALSMRPIVGAPSFAFLLAKGGIARTQIGRPCIRARVYSCRKRRKNERWAPPTDKSLLISGPPAGCRAGVPARTAVVAPTSSRRGGQKTLAPGASPGAERTTPQAARSSGRKMLAQPQAWGIKVPSETLPRKLLSVSSLSPGGPWQSLDGGDVPVCPRFLRRMVLNRLL